MARRVILAVALCGAALAAAGCGSSSSSSGAHAGNTASAPTVYLSLNYIGNGWRTQMVSTAKWAATHGPLAGKANLKVVVSADTNQAQISDINNMIEERPKAILVDAGSAVALNPVIQRACAAGIIVVGFDDTVTAPCAYNVQLNWVNNGNVLATWLANSMGKKGQVILDQGIPGTSVSDQLYQGEKATLAKYPNIKIDGVYQSQYSGGTLKQAVSSLLNAHPGITGIMTDGFITQAAQAVSQAGLKQMPMTEAAVYNSDALVCTKSGSAGCAGAGDPPYQSAEALKLALALLAGTASKSVHNVTLYPPFGITHDSPIPGLAGNPKDPTYKMVGLPKQSPNLVFPYSPTWLSVPPAAVS